MSIDWFIVYLIVWFVVMVGVLAWGIPRIFNRWAIEAISKCHAQCNEGEKR